MAVRCYVVPQNDPNGHAGQTWCTDDAGNFWAQRPGDPAPGAANPATSPTTPSTSPTPSVNPGAGAGSVAGAVGGLVDPTAIKALMDLASQSAQQAYLNARLELEKQTAGQQWTAQQEQLAQAAAHDAWQKAIAGREADVQQAASSGYIGGVNEVADRVSAAWNRLPADQRTGANAAAIWQTQVPGLTADEAARVNEAAHQYAAVNGTAMPADIVGQTLAAVTNGRITGQTATLAREQAQNQTGLGLLQLGAQLRGPDNAFAYARTLQNTPPEMRAQLDAMMQRAGISYGGPGLGAMAGQISQGGLAPQQQQAAGMTQQAQVMPMLGQVPGQTQQAGNAMVAAPGVGGMPVLRTGQAQPEATQQGGNYMTYTGPQSPSSGGVTGQPATPQTPLTQQSGNAMTYQGASTGGQGVQHLSQLSPQQWNNTNEYVKRLMMAGYDDPGSGTSAMGEQSAYQMSLPKYSGPTSARLAA